MPINQDVLRPSLRVLLAACVTAGMTWHSQPVSAADLEWTNTTPGLLLFDIDTNWNPVNAPDGADNVLFNLDEMLTIVIGAPSSANNFRVTAGDWTFTGGSGTSLATGGEVFINDASMLTGATATITGTSTWDNVGNAFIGDTGLGTLNVSNDAAFRAENVFIGDDAGSIGVINVDGPGSLLTADATGAGNGLFIGFEGTGTLNVTDGGTARTLDVSGIPDFLIGYETGSEGTLNIDGAGSLAVAEDMLVGREGTGHLLITNGGFMNQNIGNSADGFVAYDVGSTADAVVNGDNSLWQMRRLDIGRAGNGTLSVEAGGVVRTVETTVNGDIIIGTLATGTGKVAVSGTGIADSLLDVDTNLVVGDIGLGVLNIGLDLNDNAVGTGDLQVDGQVSIGDDAGNTFDNKLLIRGANTSANVGTNLYAGIAGRGTLDVGDGATVTVGGALGAGIAAGGNGTILIDGPGTTVTANTLFIGNANAGANTDGTIIVSDQAVVTLTGTSNGVVTLGDDTNSSGTLTITGAGSRVESTGGTAEWWIGGSENSDGIGGYGQLNVLDGGQAITTGRVVLGYKGTATGEVNVDGAGSLLDANGDYILVGFNNDGNAEVTNGGRIEANRMLIADAAGSSNSFLQITGSDGINPSTVNLTGLLHVGDSDRGTMEISDGGRLNVATTTPSARLIIGDEDAADGSSLTVTGAGSRIDYFGTERITVGMAGGSAGSRARLEVLDGAVVQAVQRNPDTTIASQGYIIVGDEVGGHGQIDVDGQGSRIEARYLELGQADFATGQVNITGGGVIELTEFTEIGAAGNSGSELNVDGSDSRFDVAGRLSIGAGGTSSGVMNIHAGATVTTGQESYIGRFTGSLGTANVVNGTWEANNSLYIGGTEDLSIAGSQSGSGDGQLWVFSNGRVQVTGMTVIKDRGIVTLSGGELATDDLLFQDFDDASRPGSPAFTFFAGTLRFTDSLGYTLETHQLENILGTNPTLTANKTLAVDALAVVSGPLRIDGGTFSVGSISTGSMANVDFDAGTFKLTDSSLVVTAGGLFGKDLTIQPDQTINVTHNTFIQADGTLTVVGNFNVGGTIVNNGDLALIDATGAGKTFNGTLDSPAGSTVTLIGDITFNDPVNGGGGFFGPGTANFAGGFSPGDSPGVVGFEGDVVLADSNTLFVELGGTLVGEFDRLEVDGLASIDGTLDVSLINGYVPTLGDNLGFLFANGGFGGTFDTLNLPDLSGLGLDWLLNPGESTLFLEVIATLPGDLDGDGFVGINDLNIVLGNWNQNVPPANPLADPSGDGFVGIDDLNEVLGNWNAGTPPGVPTGDTSTAVPEPASILLMLGMLGGLHTRRRS